MSKTIADAIRSRETFYVTCGHPMCNHSTQLDLQALGARLGLDHGAMHNDLVKVFRCDRCKQAGRDQRPAFFTCIPDYGRFDRERMGTKG